MNIPTEAEIDSILSRIDPDARQQQVAGRGDLRAAADVIRSLRAHVKATGESLRAVVCMIANLCGMRTDEFDNDFGELNLDLIQSTLDECGAELDRACEERDQLRARIAEFEAGGWRPIISTPSSELPFRVLHAERGTIYTVLAKAELQSSADPVGEGTVLTIYRGADGNLWARPSDEFSDGRFTVTPPAGEVSDAG